MTARVTMVPGRLFLGVLGTTLAARNCCLPVFAKSPNRSTWVSTPSSDCAADWISSGTAGPAGFASAAGAGFGADVSGPQPDRKPITLRAPTKNGREIPPIGEILRLGSCLPPHEVKDGVAPPSLAAARQQLLCIDLSIKDLAPPM